MMIRPIPQLERSTVAVTPPALIRAIMVTVTRWRQTWSSARGFTLIELVIVIVIMGVMTFYAMPRFDYGSVQVAAVSRKLVEELRYAQNLAVTTQIPHGIIVNNCGGVGTNCTQYTVFKNGNPNDPAKDPLTGQSMVTQMTGPYNLVTLSTTLPNQMVCFDKTGSPFSNATCDLNSSTTTRLPATNNTIDLKAGCTIRLTITVATGLVSEGQCS
jgi:prepilin-type N-terminal cleavage/methylation domain-containing protein